MPKLRKYVLITTAALLILVVAGIGIVVATFDPNDYKPQLISLVQEKTQRTLTIPGDIGLRVFPRFGLELGPASISERNSKAEFASVERAKVSLALLPLLSRQLVVDRVQVDGLRAVIRRGKDGQSNYDDLLSKPQAPGQPAPDAGRKMAFDIDGIEITNARVSYDDQQQARKFDIAILKLETGKIANGVPGKLQLAADIKGNRPEIDARVNATTGFTMDLDKKQYAFRKMEAELRGALAGFSGLQLRIAGDADLAPDAKRFNLDGIRFSASGKRANDTFEANVDIPKLAVTDKQVAGGKISGQASLKAASRNVTANFSAPSFEGTRQAFRVPSMTLDAVIREGQLDAKLGIAGALAGDLDKQVFSSPQLSIALSGKQGNTPLKGSLATPLSVNLGTQAIDLPKLVADFSLPNPGGGTLSLKAGGNANIHLGKQSASAALTGSIDQSAFNAKLGITDFTPMRYAFDIGIDRLDLDRYKSKPPASQAKAPAGDAKTAGAPQPMDFSALQDLRASGSVRVGALKAANIHASNVRLDLRADKGRMDVSPLSANLYGGSASGALSLMAGKPARVAVRQNLSGVNVGPLLKDAIGKDPIEGRGNVQLDVAAAGATFDQMKKALDGSARLELRDGAVRGVNIAQVVRSARARLDALRGESGQQAQTGTGSTSEKTDFSEMTGSFRITNGVARNEDLQVKSPLIRVTGSGDIDLGNERIDYLARTTVVSTLQGQGGPELQALKGVTVPVRLSGPFNAIGWRIDLAGMASELAKQKLDERKGELKEKAGKALDEQKEKVRDQLKEQLKGLLGR